MVRCPSCSARWPDTARFCGTCGATLPRTCRDCGEPLPAGARFCLSCGAPVEEQRSAAPPARTAEERREVTILFVDLVGFTERSDHADPEDVRTTLLPFHARVKEDIERYGGTLDKFIGDAVMGVFGAPVAHEDDPLRAVRTALRILRTMDELRERDATLQIRVAVNTGEAVVALGEGPQVGEAVAGDVVNTASRMQPLAPPGGVVIGEATYRHVRDRFVAERLPPSRVKGKAEPIIVWQVFGERDPGTTARVSTTSFVGREHELRLLEEVLDRATTTSTPQVATITGEAGIGKSRLVDELGAAAGDRARRIEGRCLPYGESVTFAPLADLVRAAADVDPAESSAGALEHVRHAFVSTGAGATEAAGFTRVLAPVLGLADADDTEVAGADIGAALAALVRPADRPILTIVHDLHWADDVVLEVLAAAIRHLEGAPVVVVGTARPEFFDRDIRWPPPAVESTLLRLTPLSPEQMEALVVSMIANVALGSDARASLLERAGGNPLFALEYVRMLLDDVDGGAHAPDTIQALIGARIDAVPASPRARILDASVAGTEFWPGLLAAMGGVGEVEVREDVTALMQRGLAQPTTTSIDGHAAFSFSHDLFREIAYGRIPRAERARRHVAAAEWLETTVGADRGELLAQHYGQAFELATAARDGALVERARGPAARWLVDVGRRALSADPRGAFASLDRAATIADTGSAEQAEALVLSALAGRRCGLLAPADVLDRYGRAERVRRRLGDEPELAEVLTRMSSQLAIMGRASESRERLGEAIGLLGSRPTDRRLAAAYAYRAEAALFAGDREAAMADAERTLDILGDDTMDELMVMALHVRGDARCSLGDRGGLSDLQRALDISIATHRSTDVVTSESYVADWTLAFEGPASTWPHYEHAIAVAEQSGVVSQGLWSKAGALFSLYELERDDDVLRLADEILTLGEDRVDATVWVFAHVMRSEVLLDRGRHDEVVDRMDLLERARAAEDVQAIAPALVTAARIAVTAGDRRDAERLLHEFADLTRDVGPEFREAILARAARLAVRLHTADVLADLIDASTGELSHHSHNLASARAALLEVRGRSGEARDAYREAATGWERFGSRREAAFARVAADRCAARDDPVYSPGLDRNEPKEG
ncbi:MAG: ATP-binding protein [Actinomycetota bacterium]